ncbi:MAG: sensor histidine kinase [Thermoanaerobacteraceae bacterium]|nr:sensor histidine kinase [Thermoanaerobacteraceae bacterium]
MFENIFSKYYLPCIDFLGGLIFFLMGFVILLQYLQYYQSSSLKIVSSVWLLSLFGLFFGITKWLNFFLLFVFDNLPQETLFLGHLFSVIISAVSFIFLYLFGVELLVSTFKRYYRLRYTAPVIFLLWVVIFLLSYPRGQQLWLYEGRMWLYIILAFPGAILVSLALVTQIKDFAKLNISKLFYAVYGATGSFFCYAISAGALLPSWNKLLVGITTNTPIFTDPPLLQFFRAVCGIGMAFFILRIMQIFNFENNKKLELARITQAILEERNRISRDLHDGVIQSLYGIGLSLETTLKKPNLTTAQINSQVKPVMEKLQETIEAIRQYIQGLSPVEKHTYTLREAISALSQDLASHTNLAVNVVWRGDYEHRLTPYQIDNIYHIVQETLSNAAKHARASELKLIFDARPEQLVFSIVDDGIGMQPQAKISNMQRGLKNIKERADQLGGTLKIDSKKNRGTTIKVTIPWGGKESDSKSFVNSG